MACHGAVIAPSTIWRFLDRRSAVADWASTLLPVACYPTRVTVVEISAGLGALLSPAFVQRPTPASATGLGAWFGAGILEVDESVLFT